MFTGQRLSKEERLGELLCAEHSGVSECPCSEGFAALCMFALLRVIGNMRYPDLDKVVLSAAVTALEPQFFLE